MAEASHKSTLVIEICVGEMKEQSIQSQWSRDVSSYQRTRLFMAFKTLS